MMLRLILLFVPSALGLLWWEAPRVSIAWSLAGSVFIAAIAQTAWFRQARDRVPFSERLLRPTFMFHAFFVAFHVAGGAAHALSLAGYRWMIRLVNPSEFDLALVATAQGLMLLGHAGVTAGMKLVGTDYPVPRYALRALPPYGLLIVSGICTLLSFFGRTVPGLFNLSHKLIDLALVAILVELALSIKRRHFTSLGTTIALLTINLIEQVLSGWKGSVLMTMIPLGGMLYPLMRRAVLVGGAAFVLVWALYLYPFGATLRSLWWYQGTERDMAVQVAANEAWEMSLEDRLYSSWQMLSVRGNDLTPFRRYLRYVPEVRPFYGTEIVQEAFIGLIPRIVWEDKPDLEALVMRRAYDAGVIANEHSTVSAKANFFQEAYLSGGWLAVLGASILCGALIMLTSRVCERWFGGYTMGTCLVYTGLFAVTFNMPQSFLFLVNGAWASALIVLVLFILGRLSGFILAVEPSRRPARPAARPMAAARARV